MRRLVLLSLFATAPALAQARASALTEVHRELAEGEFERALAKADAALKKATDAGEVARLQLARGQAFHALGKPDKAKAAFAAAIQKDATVELDAARASPELMRLFEKARAEFPATLAVSVADGEASITIDDKDLGPAPLQLQVDAGPHVVQAKAADGRTARRDVQAAAGRKLEVSLELGAAAKAPSRPAAPMAAAPPAAAPPPSAAAVPAPTASDSAAAPPGLAARASSGRSGVALVPLVGGAVVAVGGGVLLGLAYGQHQRLTNPALPPLSPAEEQAAMASGPLFQTLGWVGLGVGAAAAVAGALMFAAAPSSDDDARLGVFVGPDGAVWVSVRGHFF